MDAQPHTTYECRSCETVFELQELGAAIDGVDGVGVSCPICDGDPMHVGRAA